jgi:short-subunit dehydrogenase
VHKATLRLRSENEINAVTLFELTGEIAVVTGAGIGYAIAKALARAGADIVGISRTPSDIDALASEIVTSRRRTLKIPADISSKE